MQDDNTDKPGVIALPGVIYLVAFGIAYGLHQLLPVALVPNDYARTIAAALAVVGAGLIAWGIATMRGAGTNIDPGKPALALVTAGPFRFSRNPLYLALTILYLALAFGFNMASALVVLVPLIAVMHYGVITREETYLEAKFGETYRNYRAAVRRWL